MTKSGTKPRMHWSKFKWQDYSNDPLLRVCSLASQGLWMRMLCLMHNDDRYGHLVLAGKTMTLAQLAPSVGWPASEIAPLLDELEQAGVFSRCDDGTIFNRRMVRDFDLYQEAAENGKRGGNPNLKRKAVADAEPAGDVNSAVFLDNPGGVKGGVETTHKLLELEERKEERVLATLVAAPPLPDDAPKRSQGNLLDPTGEKSPTDGQVLFSDGLAILAKLSDRDIGSVDGKAKVARLLAKMRKEMGEGNDAALMDILRRAQDQPPANAIGWIKGAITNGKGRLVVSNDPNDAWGIDAWCAANGIEQSGPEDRKLGKWICHGRFFDKSADMVATAARLPRNWRGDWSPLEKWLALGIHPRDIARIVERMSAMDGYTPGNLMFFHRQITAGNAAAA